MATTEIQVYESADFGSIRVFEENGQLLFVAPDVARTLGYHEAKDMIRSLDADEFTRHTVPTNKGPREVYVITEPGLYHAILMRKAACVKDPEARARVEAFQHWVNHEVLPAIRRNGAYVNPAGAETPEELIARALTAANEIIARREQRIKALEAENDGMRPKAAFADAVSGCGDAILIGDLSKYLKQNGINIGRNRLFERMREDGYLIKRKGSEFNHPTQKSMEMGLMTMRETLVATPRGDKLRHTPLITGKGQQYFLRRYRDETRRVGQ